MPAIFHLDGSVYNPKPSEVNRSLLVKYLECGPRICLAGFFKASYSYDNQASPSSLFCSLLKPSCCYETIMVRFCLSRRTQLYNVPLEWTQGGISLDTNFTTISWVFCECMKWMASNRWEIARLAAHPAISQAFRTITWKLWQSFTEKRSARSPSPCSYLSQQGVLDIMQSYFRCPKQQI